ncbi:hypothetical protein ABG768_012400 [Culter alburnus]|uniref:Uncharacterized protein n=1 Tax=Culter alburnus TaxID=194366 RepID=A0AAW1ZBI1_CULAL
MKSDGSVRPAFKAMIQFKGDRSISPEPSCVSKKSDQSMMEPVTFKGKHTSTNMREQSMDTRGTIRGRHMPSNLRYNTST